MLFDFSIRRGAGRDPGGSAARPSSPTFFRWTLLVVRFRQPVLAAWLVLLAVGIAAVVALPGRLVTSYSVPGTGSDRTDAALARGFGERPEGSFTVVFRIRRASDSAGQRRLRARLARAAGVLPGGRVGPLRAGAGIVYAELATSLSLERAKGYTATVRQALRAKSGPVALVTGEPAIQHDLDPQLATDLRRGETLALPLVLIVLALLLGISLAVAVPVYFAACSIAATYALLYPVAQLVSVTSFASNVVALVGLGLAVDYSLLVVCRYREELERGVPRELAVVRTMAGAGRAVAFSGLAVAVGLALLLFVPVPFVRTMGLAGLLVPLVSVAAALTLLPAVLSLCGPVVFARLRLPGTRRSRAREPWAALARAIMRHPVAALVPASLLLLAAASAALFLRVSPGSFAGLPPTMQSARGLAAVRSGFGPGALTPTQIVVDAGAPGAARGAAVHAATERLANELLNDPEVSIVALGRTQPYLSADGRYARLLVVGRHEYGEPASRALVGRIRDRLVRGARFPAETEVLTGGAAPQGVDFLARTYAYLPWIVLIALLATYAVLARAFRSVLVPLKAVLLNLLTVAATYGLLVLVFQRGFGAELLGLHRTQEIEGWIPVFLFAALFGLSMDYEVFLVSRMREEWDAGRDNAAAVAYGLERTGRVITGAALVMAVSFSGFVVGSVPGLQQFGVGLTLAVLIDTTIVRVVLVPSSMALLGRWNWWFPSVSARLPFPSLRPAGGRNEA